MREPLSCKIGDCLQCARLFKKVGRASNDIQAFLGLELRIGTLVELNYIVIQLAND